MAQRQNVNCLSFIAKSKAGGLDGASKLGRRSHSCRKYTRAIDVFIARCILHITQDAEPWAYETHYVETFGQRSNKTCATLRMHGSPET